jgi:tyrosyl-DNA phosphodiesterase-1
MADNEQNDMEAAIQQSLKQLENDLEQQKREREEIRQAIALSLGKPVERLTARETLAATLESSIKRPLDESTSVATESKKQNTGKPSMPTYLDGVVRLTHVKGTSGPDYITIGQVIEAKYLKKALLTAFVVSMDFVEEQFPEHINVCIVMHGRQVITYVSIWRLHHWC